MKYLSRSSLVTLLFFICWSMTSFTLFELDQPLPAKIGYGLFSLTCLFSFLVCETHMLVKRILATVSYLSILLVGIVFFLDIEAIEEVYMLIPLLYVMIFPGSLMPILVSLTLLSAYVGSLENAELVDILEDGIELVGLAVFASVMAFFQKKAHMQMAMFRKESYTDYLTDLGNRKRYLETLESCIERCNTQENLNFALLIVDLDGFKKVNDQQGHIVGDSALKLVADRLTKLTNQDTQLFRIGGDEFAFVCLPQQNVVVMAEQLAKQIVDISRARYLLNQQKYLLTASIGIAIMPDDANDANDAETLCSHADMAMYQSKQSGKNTYSFYEQALSEKAFRRYTLESDLKTAIENNQLSLHYQPKVCAETSKIVSAEALLRWQHPTLGYISPVEFIAIAEQTGMILKLGDWVIEHASKQAVKWCQLPDFDRVAVNVSAIQLGKKKFVDHTLATLARTGCEPKYIELEQTESALMANTAENIKVLSELKQAGFTLSLDDFGTAYSSLSQLSQLPIDILKIDKSFVDHCASSSKAHMVVKTIIQLAQNLQMQTIAEGVEEHAQLQVLTNEGCYAYQGYYFSKPIRSDEFTQLLTATNLPRTG